MDRSFVGWWMDVAQPTYSVQLPTYIPLEQQNRTKAQNRLCIYTLDRRVNDNAPLFPSLAEWVRNQRPNEPTTVADFLTDGFVMETNISRVDVMLLLLQLVPLLHHHPTSRLPPNSVDIENYGLGFHISYARLVSLERRSTTLFFIWLNISWRYDPPAVPTAESETKAISSERLHMTRN